MEAILKVDGWSKRVQISEYIKRRGQLEIDVYPPLDIYVRKVGDNIPITKITKAKFVYNGRVESIRGLPVFTYYR